MKFFNHKSNRIQKRIVSAVLVLSLAVGLPLVAGTIDAYATSAKDHKHEAEQNLKDTDKDIKDIKDNQENIESNIQSASSNLKTIMAEIESTKNDIDNKQTEIELAAEELVEAQAKADEEYESMKLRIQFMYENSTEDSIWSAILDSNGFVDMLTRLEYISDVHASDRALLTAYNNAVLEVEAKQNELNAEMAELVALQEQYEAKQQKLEKNIAALEAQQAAYADDLEEALKLHDQYTKEVAKWAEVIRQQEAAAAKVNASTYNGGGTGKGGLSGSVAYLTDDSYDPAFQTSITGDELVAFALQYVGYPYVWGGNSLTNGCDCSGFVHLVYQHFGISTPRYSQSFKTVGQPVSYNNIKAGDIVVYDGHVAIAIGNGCIVEAQSTKAGITCGRSVQCHTVTAIRRLL